MKWYIKQWINDQGWLMAVVISTCLLPSALHADIPYSRTAIYYDQPATTDTRGVAHAITLCNFLGHFKTAVYMAPVSTYSTGHIASYETVFYIGSYYNAPLPAAFLADVSTTTTTVVWMNYSIDKLLNFTNNTTRLGLRYLRSTTGFDSVAYKGDWLYAWTNNEALVMETTNATLVLASWTSRVDSAKAPIPYAMRSSNFWYIADSPFENLTLCDRSLVLADLLHDILGSATTTEHRGLSRIEDIAPALTSTSKLARIVSSLAALGASGSYGVIPRFRDPLGKYTNQIPPVPADLPMSQNRPFLRQIRSLARTGATIDAHGYTHESGDGVSANGWEFWDYAAATPLTNDNWAYAEARVTNSANEFLNAGFPVECWETPHYQASLVDYHVFSRYYRVAHERMGLHRFRTEGLSPAELDTLSAASSRITTRWFPYTIYRNHLGTRTLPENIDHYVATTNTEHNGRAISNLVEYAGKLRVVRDAVAGYYYHPEYDVEPVSNLVTQMQSFGYTFVSPEILSREEAVTLHTNPVPYESNTTRLLNSGTTNLVADLVLGHFAGNNTFSIHNGAGISNEEALIGFTATSHSNTMLVCDAGSTWFSAQTVFVGYEGCRNTAVVITNGTVTAMDTVIGMTTNASGNGVMISGTGSVWTNHYGLTVGQSGSSNAAYVINGGILHSRYGELGAAMTASANYSCVSGTGSLWTIENYLVIGNGGCRNHFELEHGGNIECAFGLIGVNNTSFLNRMDITDHGTAWNIIHRLGVGIDGSKNKLEISDGATVSCSTLVIGDYNLAVSNTVSIEDSDSTLSIAGDLIVGADGSYNRLIIEDGASVSCSNVVIGQYPSAGNNEIVLSGHDSKLTVSNAAGLGSINILNGKLRVENGTLTAGSFLIGNNGQLHLPTSPSNTALNLAGDFICSGTNPTLNLMDITLVFLPASQHRLGLSSINQGASLQGFVTNRALSKVDINGTVIVTNTCYVWELTGSGSLEIPTGSTFYYVDDSQWSGSVTGNGRFEKIPITFSSLLPSSNATMLIGWNSASGLTFNIEWKSDMSETNFIPATNVIGANNTDVWMDAGDVNRPAPGLATQRFYRLKAYPP